MNFPNNVRRTKFHISSSGRGQDDDSLPGTGKSPESFIVVESVTASHPWIQNLSQDFLLDKPQPVPSLLLLALWVGRDITRIMCFAVDAVGKAKGHFLYIDGHRHAAAIEHLILG